MQKSNRFVFDTNVLISAMLFPDSNPGKALKKAFNSSIVIVSKECLEELARIVMDERFEKYSSFSKKQMFLLDFENAAEFIEVKNRITLCLDPDDDKFLSLAKTANATAIISGDRDLLDIKSFENIPIISPVEFLFVILSFYILFLNFFNTEPQKYTEFHRECTTYYLLLLTYDFSLSIYN